MATLTEPRAALGRDELRDLGFGAVVARESRQRLADAEFLILLTGTDETFSQTVHARSSYVADERVFGARFTDIIEHSAPDGILSVDVSRVHAIDRVPLDRASV